MDLTDLNRAQRLNLMKFVCSFAWADLEIVDEERSLVGDLTARLELDDDEADQVREWLKYPPEVDPTDVPVEHRQLFLNVMVDMVKADGVIDGHELENLTLFEQLLR